MFRWENGEGNGALMPRVPSDYQSDGSEDIADDRRKKWCSKWCECWPRRRRPVVSEYQVLIRNGSGVFGTNTLALSDPRLRPRLPKCLIAALVILCVGAIAGVYFLVPRGVGINTVDIGTDILYLNQTLTTYTLIVQIDVPIDNPNYMAIDVSGNMSMYYYKTQAGSTQINQTSIAPRSNEKLRVTVDGSFVPIKYISSVLQNCYIFPHELVFFVRGEFRVHYMYQKKTINLDTYTFIKCPDF